jgi:hypothetical protein
MKNHWIIVTLLALITTSFGASAQVSTLNNKDGGATRRAPISGIHNGEATELADVVAAPTPKPLGPSDLLNGYEEAMASTAQDFHAEMSQIADAVQQKKITEDQGEYLSKEAYQLAMMQFQVLSGLHDMLEEQIAQTPPATPAGANGAPAAGVNGSDYQNEAPTVNAVNGSI